MVGLRESATHLLPRHTLHFAGLDLSHASANLFVPLGGDLCFVNRLAKGQQLGNQLITFGRRKSLSLFQELAHIGIHGNRSSPAKKRAVADILSPRLNPFPRFFAPGAVRREFQEALPVGERFVAPPGVVEEPRAMIMRVAVVGMKLQRAVERGER